MKQFFITAAGVFFGMAVFLAFVVIVIPVAMVGLVASAAREGDSAAMQGGDVILELDLRQTMMDQPSGAPLAFAQAPSLLDIVGALAAAETDSSISGVFIRANEGGLPAAQAQELRTALQGLREAGKFVVAHSQGFSSTSVIPYLSTTAADEIWMQQTADFSAAGLSTETTFLGGLIEKYDAEAEILQIAEYKNAANSYNESDYTDAHRQSLTAILQSVYDQSVEMIASDRGLTPEEVDDLLADAPYSAEQAARAGLVDRIGHLVEAREATLARTERGRFVPIAEYVAEGREMWGSGPVIALISGQGEIVTGESWDQDILSSGDIMGSDTVAQAFLDAAEDSAVRAIVFRIDSPGGSIVASEQIWHAVTRARDAGKPVVVSMGPTAASGGYYVAAPADAILAQPSTLTGSIGIYGGKIVIDGALELVGLNIEPLTVGGPFSGAYTSQRPFTATQRAAIQQTLENGYADFTGHVAEGRNLPLERVQEIARGRVWTGVQAFELGLVDELGGFRDAIARAKALADIDDGASITLKPYPTRLTPFEQLQRLFGVSAESAEAVAVLARIASSPAVLEALETSAAAERMRGQSEARSDLPAIR